MLPVVAVFVFNCGFCGSRYCLIIGVGVPIQISGDRATKIFSLYNLAYYTITYFSYFNEPPPLHSDIYLLLSRLSPSCPTISDYATLFLDALTPGKPLVLGRFSRIPPSYSGDSWGNDPVVSLSPADSITLSIGGYYHITIVLSNVTLLPEILFTTPLYIHYNYPSILPVSPNFTTNL